MRSCSPCANAATGEKREHEMPALPTPIAQISDSLSQGLSEVRISKAWMDANQKGKGSQMQITVCDICKDYKVSARRVSLVYGREADASGSMSDEVYFVDLCFQCELNAYHKFVSALIQMDLRHPHEANSLLIEIIKKAMIKNEPVNN